MLMKFWIVFWLAAVAPCSRAAERINQEGRILGPVVPVNAPTLFNTAAADSVVSSMQIMPVTSAWNEDISKRPLLPNSDAMINEIISDLATNRRTLRVFFEMNFVLVPDTQALVWPRQWALDPDAAWPDTTYFSTTEIPQRVKDACCELALQQPGWERPIS